MMASFGLQSRWIHPKYKWSKNVGSSILNFSSTSSTWRLKALVPTRARWSNVCDTTLRVRRGFLDNSPKWPMLQCWTYHANAFIIWKTKSTTSGSHQNATRRTDHKDVSPPMQTQRAPMKHSSVEATILVGWSHTPNDVWKMTSHAARTHLPFSSVQSSRQLSCLFSKNRSDNEEWNAHRFVPLECTLAFHKDTTVTYERTARSNWKHWYLHAPFGA